MKTGHKFKFTTRLEYLDWVAEHYNSENRGTKGAFCLYSEGCAVGYWMKKKDAKQADAASVVLDLSKHGIPTCYIPSALLDMGCEFLADIQNLHDTADYWDNTGLSPVGLKQYNLIKNEHCND